MLLGRSTLARSLAVWLAVALLVGGVAALSSPATRAAFVPLQPADALMHAPRGDADGVYRFAEAVGSARLPDTRAYLDEIYRLAPLVGLDPAILVGQSALETGYWRGKFWVSDLNPAGIRITNDDQPTSFHWATGADAARGHIYHLYVYAAGVPPAGHLLDQYRALDPRVQNAVDAGYAGTKTTIQSLEGSWATMSLYAQGLCNKANEILGYAERTTTTPTRTSTATPLPVKPEVVLSKAKSKYNGAVVATLSGFTPEAVVTLAWPDGVVVATATAGSSGAGEATFRTPLVPYGTYRVAARDTAGKVATASLSVIPRILLNETEGPTTTRMRVYCYGFSPGERVEVRWYTADGASYAVIKTIGIAENGRGSSLIVIPADTEVGVHKVVGRVVGVARSASTSFTATADLAGGGLDHPAVTVSRTPGVGTPTVTPTGTATPEAVSSPTLVPTATVTATATPTIEPSATPSATSTPESTATPEPTLVPTAMSTATSVTVPTEETTG